MSKVEANIVEFFSNDFSATNVAATIRDIELDAYQLDKSANHMRHESHLATAALIAVSTESERNNLMLAILRNYDCQGTERTGRYQNYVKALRRRLQEDYKLTFTATRKEIFEKDAKGKKTGKSYGFKVTNVVVKKHIQDEKETRAPQQSKGESKAKASKDSILEVIELTIEDILQAIEQVSDLEQMVRISNKARTKLEALKTLTKLEQKAA